MEKLKSVHSEFQKSLRSSKTNILKLFDKNSLERNKIRKELKKNQTDDDYALRWASRNGNLAIVKLLLKNGADIHE